MTQIQICPVPYNQRPSNEYLNLKNSFNFSWIFQDSKGFLESLVKPVLFIYLISYTIVLNIHSRDNQITPKLIAELFISTSFFLMIYMIQSYLACKYIYDRLMLSVITYEESGWYDGQTWIKSKEILVQDRLIGTYELRPKLEKLKIIIISLCILLGINSSIYILN